MKTIKKRLRSLFVATFFAEMMFQYAIFLPYMHHLGITTAQIALYVIINNVVILSFETPSGILADRWSRKKVLMIGMIAMLAGLLIIANAHSFVILILGSILTSIYFAVRSGMKEAMVYDALLEMGQRSAYEQQIGRLRLYSSVANVISSLLGALLAATVGFPSAFYASCVSCLLFIVFLQGFHEPQLHRQAEAVKLVQHIGDLVRSIGKSREMKALVVVSILAGIEYNYMQQLDQLWPIALNLSVILYGPLNALLLSSQAVPALLIKRLAKRPSYVGLLGVALVVSAAGLFIRNIIVIALSEFILLALATTLMILLSGRIQDELPSSHRSGVESAISTFSTLAFIGTVFIFSAVTKSHSVFVASWILVVVAILAAIGAQISLSKRVSVTS